jgi:hypothetical protein
MSKQLVVIDRKVANYQSLIDQLGQSYSYLLLDAESDGGSQIADYVTANPGFDAIHLISQGSPLGVAVSPISYSLMAVRPLEGFGATPTMTPAESLKESSGNSAPFRRMTEHRLRQAERTKNSLIQVGLNKAFPTRDIYLKASQIECAFMHENLTRLKPLKHPAAAHRVATLNSQL